MVAPPSPPDENVVTRFVSEAIDQVARLVRPEAAAAVATTFGFPLVLTLAVGLFVIVQGRLDHRDPKLRAAPMTTVENVQTFRMEEQL